MYSTVPFVPCWYDDSTLTSLQTLWCHIHFFANSTFITTSFLKLPFLPSFPSPLLSRPLSCSLSFLVSLCIVVLWLLLIVVVLFVISPWWIVWWFLFFTVGTSLPYCTQVQYGLHGTVVSVHLLYSTIPTMLTFSASLLYRMPVWWAALYGSFRSPAGCTVTFVTCCWYNESTQTTSTDINFISLTLSWTLWVVLRKSRSQHWHSFGLTMQLTRVTCPLRRL